MSMTINIIEASTKTRYLMFELINLIFNLIVNLTHATHVKNITIALHHLYFEQHSVNVWEEKTLIAEVDV